MEINNRLLIVDDNEAIHRDFQKILQSRREEKRRVDAIEQALFGDESDAKPGASEILPIQEYDMDFAFQAKEALDMITLAEKEGRPYAVVFTDVRMPPGLDGVQMVEQILELDPFLEIVIVTAYADYTWDELVEKFGWTDRIIILRKPFDGITIKQIASTLTRKWAMGYQARQLAQRMSLDMDLLERKVEERTARLTEAYKELQNFAYIVSHDLRSPLVSIRGFVSELRFDLEKVLDAVEILIPNLGEEQRKALEVSLRDSIPEAMDFIDTSTTKMDRLIKGILKLARLGHRVFQYEDLDLKEMAEHQIKVLAYPIEKNHIDIISDALPVIHSDRLAMEQILSNLLSNAVKYLATDRQGKIHILATEEGDKVHLQIKDNGRGIEVEDQEQIFDIFRRGRDIDIPGEGMGLTYVKTLVQRLGGQIHCESKRGEGSCFTLVLPKSPSPETLQET